MNNKPSLYSTSRAIRPTQKVTVPAKGPGWKATQGLEQLKTAQAVSLKSDSTPVKASGFFFRLWEEFGLKLQLSDS